jgi:hypothetical protein
MSTLTRAQNLLILPNSPIQNPELALKYDFFRNHYFLDPKSESNTFIFISSIRFSSWKLLILDSQNTKCLR